MHEQAGNTTPAAGPENGSRRGITAAGAAMAVGLAAGYGTFAWLAARFLYPARKDRTAWLFVTPLAEMRVGQSLRYRTPAGATVNITRRANLGTDGDFQALSSTCPHLGCQVHFQPDQNRYVCPCHNGVFDAQGKGIGGPPGDAGQNLGAFPLKVENGLLYIQVPVESLAAAGEILDPHADPEGPGHDPCLRAQARRGLPA